MTVEERINAFEQLGVRLTHMDSATFQSIAESARLENPWFTEENVAMAFSGIQKFLSREVLVAWTSTYTFSNPSKKIALIMAGNIPLVGFHDLLCVLLSGHSILLKQSSKDTVLTKFIIAELIAIEPRFASFITITEEYLKEFDAVIATGSDNAARYFDFYFKKYPHIIRKNRTSVAILDGTETTEMLTALGSDVFRYFGLGCRNVSKIFVPKGYSFNSLFESWEGFSSTINHHKYFNNYEYQKSILLINGNQFLDNGFVMLQESEKLVSPISVLFIEYYDSLPGLEEKLLMHRDKIQCIVGNTVLAKTKFGQAQFPVIEDYADQIDTLKFLTTLL